jgi:hypothetical protein
MAMVDANGRLWGRVNLFDAVLAVLVLALLPLGYGAYALFRTPPPVLTSVEPATVTDGPNLRVTVRGVNLRPFLRVSFDTIQGRSFLFDDSTRAQVELNPMPPGTYGVVLYDYNSERSRLPNALTILPSPTPLPTTKVIVVGRLINLKPELASQVKPGLSLPFGNELLETGRAGPAWAKVYVSGPSIDVPVKNLLQVPVKLRMGCDIRAPGGYPECYGARFPLRPAYMGPLDTSLGDMALQVDHLAGDQPFEYINVVVRLAGVPGVLSQVRLGDADASMTENELAFGATVAALMPLRKLSDDAADTQATFRVRTQGTPAGWIYNAALLRIGSPFAFRSTRYEVNGTVLSVTKAGTGTAQSK